MMTNLANQSCQHDTKGEGILTPNEQQEYLQALDAGWEIITIEKQEMLFRQFNFKCYIDVLAFVAKVGEIAETHNHHPEMLVKWSECHVSFHTHSAGGITLNDIICAHLLEKIA